MRIARYVVVFGLLFLGLLLGACSGLTQSNIPANTSWWLEPFESPGEGVPAEKPTRVTLSVTVVPGLDSNRILTLSDDARLNRYSAARWADNLPELVTSLVARTMNMSGRFDVGSATSRQGPGDCALQLEVAKFFAELDGSGKTTGVRIAVNGDYQCAADVAVAIDLSSSVPVYSDRMSVIVAAFQEAMDEVLAALLVQVQ